MNRTHQIRILAALAVAMPVTFAQPRNSASAQTVPAGYTIAYLANGQPVLVSLSAVNGNAPQATNAVYNPAGSMSAFASPAPLSPNPSPYPGPPTYVGQGAGVYGQQQARRIMLPAGAALFVRTAQALHSNALLPGATFDCYLDAPWYQGDVMIADRGARVEARVVESDLAGKISGQARLAVQVFRIQTADGKAMDIHTTTYSLLGGTSYGKDAARIATGAAVGALIGGLTGGGKGAAIGAGVGAGGGTIWTMKTRGPQVTIPSETMLQFQLVTPVTFVTW